MTIVTELEELSTLDTEGCKWRGALRTVIQGKENALFPYILSANESGSLCIHGAASGSAFVLPPPVVGAWFEFLATVSVTSTDVYSVTTDAATTFIIGAITGLSLTLATSGDTFSSDGTEVTITSNGGTTGGLIGDSFTLTCISSTEWAITRGFNVGSSTNATSLA